MGIDNYNDLLLATAGDEYLDWADEVDPWPFLPVEERAIAGRVYAGMSGVDLQRERRLHLAEMGALHAILDAAGAPGRDAWGPLPLAARLVGLIAERDGLRRQRDEAWAREVGNG